jgi:long-chain acyl-CoA synthetase
MTVEATMDRMTSAFPRRITDVLSQWAERLPEHPALVEDRSTWTYSQLLAATEQTNIFLAESGVRPGDRVMIVGENCRAFVALFLATASLGAWPVLASSRLSFSELEGIRAHCGARRMIFTTAGSHQSQELAKLHRAVLENVRLLGSIGLGPLDETVEPEPIEADPANGVAAVIYTSGTTGTPKGVMLTHRNLIFMAEGSAHVRSLNPTDRVYGALPMSHAVGLATVLLGSLFAGACVYLVPRFDPMTARVALEKEGITLLYGTPAIFNQLLQYAKLRRMSSLNLPALRIITSSGAPLDAATKSATESLFGMVLHNGYGMTECSPTIAMTRPAAPRADTSVGLLFPGVEMKLVGNDGRQVPVGGVGELHVRGPNVMKGYYRAPQETASAIDTEGWFNTRDLARLDDGNLTIVGRTKDLIVHRGFKVYPGEIESLFNGHPAVVQSAVVGRSVGGDEEVIAFVQLSSDSSVTTADLAAYAAVHLAQYKRPSQILITPCFPLTPTGKIAKSELRRLVEERASDKFRHVPAAEMESP